MDIRGGLKIVIVLLILIVIGLGTIIKHLLNLREQNEVIIESLHNLNDTISENKYKEL